MGRRIILNALIWSAILLLVAFFYKDWEYYEVFLGIWVVGFTLVNGYLSVSGQKKKGKKE